MATWRKLKCTEPGCPFNRYTGGKCKGHQKLVTKSRKLGDSWTGNAEWKALDGRDRPFGERVRIPLSPLDVLRQHNA